MTNLWNNQLSVLVNYSIENLSKYNCVVIATDHSSYDPEFIMENSSLVIDTKNVIGKKWINSKKVVKA